MPGRSNAFAIAGKLGIDENIIQRAKDLLTEESIRFESVIEDLQKSQKKLEDETDTVTKLKFEIEKLNEEYKNRKALFEKSIEDELSKAKKKAQEIIDDAKYQTQKIINELDELKKQKNKEAFNSKLNEAKVDAKTKLNELESKINTRKKEKYLLPRPLKEGDTVIVSQYDKKATVISKPDGNGYVTVLMGIIKSKVKTDELILVESEPEEKQKSTITSVKSNKKVSTKLDIRGYNMLEAEPVLDSFIAEASANNILSVEIIHGKGTGVLRSFVHERLKLNPMVKSYRLGKYGEGETGVTIVELK